MTAGDRENHACVEFIRQVAGFRASPELSSVGLRERIVVLVEVQPRETVLEVACGTGIVAEDLARSAAAVVGIELTEAMVTEVRDRCGRAGLTDVRFDPGNAETLLTTTIRPTS